ncbi:MAG: DinB family protein [Candidatus Heimdallarchaeota archaeon]
MTFASFSFERLAEFNVWADHAVMALVDDLSEDDYYRDLGSTIGSVHIKCAHIAGVSKFFVHVLDDSLETPPKFPDLSGLTRTDLLSQWKELNVKLKDLIQQKQGRHSVTLLGGIQAALDLEHIHFDAIDHASYHRGQIMLCLRLLGKKTANTDYLMWWYRNYKQE